MESESRRVGFFEEGYEGGECVAERCGGLWKDNIGVGGGGDCGRGRSRREGSSGEEVGMDCGSYNCEVGYVEGEHD